MSVIFYQFVAYVVNSFIYETQRENIGYRFLVDWKFS